MGGVDMLDGLMGRYKITMRSRKWNFRLFYHLVDLTAANAWILYRQQKGDAALHWRNFGRKSPSACADTTVPKRGRPSEVQRQLEAKKRKTSAAILPPQGVRLDQLSHWPQWTATRQRCKRPRVCVPHIYKLREMCHFYYHVVIVANMHKFF